LFISSTTRIVSRLPRRHVVCCCVTAHRRIWLQRQLWTNLGFRVGCPHGMHAPQMSRIAHRLGIGSACSDAIFPCTEPHNPSKCFVELTATSSLQAKQIPVDVLLLVLTQFDYQSLSLRYQSRSRLYVGARSTTMMRSSFGRRRVSVCNIFWCSVTSMLEY
jgi:hypothetical protein